LLSIWTPRKGRGSHYRLRLGDRVTTVQKDLNPGRIERILKQLGIHRADL
jgi:predicted RNA binding protein YcfA (HicA-like mRNA interferase family)